MGSISGEEPKQWDAQGLTDHDERILVSVRLRPLNEKEIAKNDVSDWECINSDTIIFKNTLPERSMFPTAYTFDRVFGCDSSTKQVYEEAAKEVALSVVNGINSSIFAYGPTSSGKTYTMSGITEFTMADIYDYMQRHHDREFILKFSAMEIYNESVRDLLSTDGTPLRVLDDPERGTVIEKLIEEILMDWTHLNELLSICEAQRQIGETSVNEMSSRSHQILRLTIESSARELLGTGNSSILTATVSFIDLAGSERASQTLSAGTRLKEGCHINRSLLTLGTVIRKLSKGRNGHVPYRDSKLTRILQNSLGGNARTAIICTMSPARSHVEQSRNTLLFASCAKEVSTNAQVNVVMSDKALVKRLQKELTRLEGELRSLGSTSVTSNSTALLKENEILIGKMDKEIKELKQQRDLAESRVQDLLESVKELQVSRTQAEPDQHLKPHVPIDLYAYSASESLEVADPLLSDVTPRIFDRIFNSNKDGIQLTEYSEDNFMPDSITPQVFLNKFFGPDPCRGWETIAQKTELESEGQCKEVRCIEMEKTGTDKNIIPGAISSPLKGDRDLNCIDAEGTYKALKQKIQDMKKTVDCLASPELEEHSSCSSGSGSRRSVNLCRSRSCRAILMSLPSSSWFGEAEQNENISPIFFDKDFLGRPKEEKHSELRFGSNNDKFCRNDSQTSARSASMDEKKQDIKMSGDDDTSSVQNCATELDEVVKSKSLKEPGDDMNEEAEIEESEQESNETGKKVNDGGSEMAQCSLPSPSNWPLEFERQRRELIELWEACNVPLVHRSCFFMLFKGDPSESVYMEVELRRLSFIKNNSSHGTRSLKHGDTAISESR